MSDPVRLKDGDGLDARLLQSAREDGPSPSARRAIAGAIGIAAVVPTAAKGTGAAAAATTPAAPAAAVAAKTGLPLVAKLVAGITLATGVGVGIVIKRRAEITSPPPIPAPASSASPAPPPDRASLAPSPVEVSPPPPAIAKDSPAHAATTHVTAGSKKRLPEESARAGGEDVTTPVDVTATDATEVAPVEVPPTEVAKPASAAPTLADEVAVLEIALAALRAHDAGAALRALDRYDHEFPRGTLGDEAAVARIEATFAAGDRTRGKELAARFLSAHPGSPLTQRVRALGDR